MKAVTSTGTIINIEVQVNRQKFYEKRAVYYASKIASGELKVGDPYEKVPKVLSVNILDFILYEEIAHCPISFQMREVTTNKSMTNAPEYYFLELPKLKSIQTQEGYLNKPINQWLVFLNHDTKSTDFKEVIQMNNTIRKAEETLNNIQNNPEQKALYDARFKEITDKRNEIDTAVSEAVSEAVSKARIENAVKVIKTFGLDEEKAKESLKEMDYSELEILNAWQSYLNNK